MKVLHTSDWHIGKRLLGRERIAEQRAVLQEIAQICEREKIELVLVAGDVFDTYLPSSEAEDVFYSCVKELAGSDRTVVIISGNHDDNVRLSAATALAEEYGIYIYGNNLHVPTVFAKRATHPVRAGANYMVVENARGERVFVNILPYPTEARFKEDKNPDESFYDRIRRWIQAGEAENNENLPLIFLSHIFVAGGAVSEGERDIDLGGARAVPVELLPECDYIALGHLHRKQHLGNDRNIFYSGSILQYAFDEANVDKKVIVFEIGEAGVFDLREIKLSAGKKLVRLACDGLGQAKELLACYENCYIELTLYLNEPLVPSQIKELKECNEGLISIIPEIKSDTAVFEYTARKNRTATDLFTEYYKSQYNQEPPHDLLALFLEIAEGTSET